ncbi:hypothetical protein N7466_011518 [Penicillium verhagenii]|uniref:uncharacterized protein n=1 Tax=Penicillium verhagenii TaxID=1562060 RepID=UPI00254582E9|nr:uncharacterized protein N7466_011518 [Penicillium verhagenii]KAJ5915585.1 hypothetical protein N7466_011518 [Penicillium verhagenii]
MGCQDDWPAMADGSQYDGKQLITLVREGKSPFQGLWNVNLLIQEIEKHIGSQVVDIPAVEKGSNNYGFHIKTSGGPDMIARLSRSDVNMPHFDGFPVEAQASEAIFEAAVYNMLCIEPEILTSRLLYHRGPVLYSSPTDSIPQDLAGRRLFLFEKADGEKNVWKKLNATHKIHLLDQLANIRASLFRYNPPPSFMTRYFLSRVFEFMPETLSVPVSPTREFLMYVMESKINATIRTEGDMIGWEGDNETVGPVALKAKETLLRALPHIMPLDHPDGCLYRLVLEHGDFGIHNTTINHLTNETPLVTSLYDWETGCIVPAILSDPLVAVSPVDLTAGKNGEPSVTRLSEDDTKSDLETYTAWARHYIQVRCYTS